MAGARSKASPQGKANGEGQDGASQSKASPQGKAAKPSAPLGDSAERAASHLAHNIRELREQRRLSQQQLAELSGVPRPTIANLETGGSNPTLAVLVKLAEALYVSIEELIVKARPSARLYPAGSLPSRVRGRARVQELLPEPVRGLEVERLELPRGARLALRAAPAGSREYLTCEAGELMLVTGESRFELKGGDVVSFRGDLERSYANQGGEAAVVYRVVTRSPSDW
ncbi:MAG: helix-turn-helix transcriptional regulator [Polyangiaceae bacterium]|nr:helix-turn-helix transcriptional regulator [Polyangiaceae bacterium]